jgi:hypothetical protein
MAEKHVKRWFRYGALAIGASALLWALWPSGVGQVQCQGQTLRVPVPYYSMKLESSECRASYFAPGEYDLKQLFITRGGALGWQFDDQVASAYYIVSVGPEVWHVAAITTTQKHFFMQIDLKARR